MMAMAILTHSGIEDKIQPPFQHMFGTCMTKPNHDIKQELIDMIKHLSSIPLTGSADYVIKNSSIYIIFQPE